MINFIEITYQTIASSQFLLLVMIVSLSLKTYFLSFLIPQGVYATKIQRPWWFLLGIIAGSMFGDIAWIIKLCREVWFSSVSYNFITFFIRLAWGFLILQYQSLALFIESLTEKEFKLAKIHKFSIFVGGSFALYFFYLAFFDTTLTDELVRSHAREATIEIPREIQIMRYMVYYLFNLILIPSLYVVFKRLGNSALPLILKKQLRIFIQFLIFPYLLIEFLQAAHFLFKPFTAYLYPTVSISTILLIYAIYYCLQQVMGLRFLNFGSQVKEHQKAHFIDDFRNVLDQLSYTTSVQELNHIIQTFFKDAFNISLRKSTTYIRSGDNAEWEQKTIEPNKIECIVEQFMRSHHIDVCNFINKHKVLIYDEIAFTNFYDEDTLKKNILEFLENINADIFLPVYEKQKIIAYIIVERHARLHEFYTKIEHDEMIVFANYLGNILNLLKNRNVELLMHQEKELREELYKKNQEVSQYKESLRSFLRNAKQKDIGIIFYKNRRFNFGNQTAKEMVKININTQEGHPLTQALKNVARQVEEYKSQQTIITKDTQGSKLIVSGVPNLEHNNVIITIYYPDVSDIISKQIVSLKDPSKWDYLLYLETTQAGQLIHQFIPCLGEMLQHFKINFLKSALSKEAIFLECAQDDVLATAELLHRISGRETFQTITLTAPEKNHEIAAKMFGTNTSFTPNNVSTLTSLPIFKKLDQTGTLYIQNIEFLSKETQDHLAEYIRYGYYKIFKSDQKIVSNIRVLCSSSYNIASLYHEGSISKNLYATFTKNILSFPSFSLISECELFELIDGFTEQALKTQAFKHVLTLNEKEKSRLLSKGITSLNELRNKVHQEIIHKSKKNHIFEETHFDPAYTVTDPELIEVARLGKQALRDPQRMSLLWNKFKNQNKIASFLGVNRSSVNRRCKDYNLK